MLFSSLSLIHPGYNGYPVRLSHAIKERVRGHSLTTQTLHMTFTAQRQKKCRHVELDLVPFWIVWDRTGWGQADKMTKPHDPLLDPVCRGGVKGPCLSLSLTDWELQVWTDLCNSSSCPELIHLYFHSPASLGYPHSNPICFIGGEFTWVFLLQLIPTTALPAQQESTVNGITFVLYHCCIHWNGNWSRKVH